MPSSTSSFKRHPREGAWKSWLLVPLMMAALMGAAEVFFRAQGYLPNLVDSPAFWSLHRDRVYTDADGRKALVVVGASRAQTGIDPDVLARHFPDHEIVHLTLDGSSPVAVLEDLCRDPDFDGTIICSLTPSWLLPHGEVLRTDLEYTTYFHETHRSLAGLNPAWNARLKAWVQGRLVIMSPDLAIHRLTLETNSIKPNYLNLQPDRFRPSDYFGRMTAGELALDRERRAAKHRRDAREPGTEVFESYVGENLAGLYRDLKSRGGELVLVRMPVSGEVWKIDQEAMPRAKYWDRIEPLSGVPTLHFADDPVTAAFTCPEGSHLDHTDAGPYTERLAILVKEKL